jgi:hypothetical protein
MLQEANSMGKGKRVTFSNKCILAWMSEMQ